jgi:hypothetical protein
MELATDLAEVIQKVSLGEYDWMLRISWTRERAQARARALLPSEIPGEVRDDFAVGLFTMVQGNLNQSATKVKAVQDFRCLTSEDYSSLATALKIPSFGALSAQNAMQNYVDRQSVRDAAAAAQSDEGPSVLGTIWSVIGWDSPTDFLKDMVIVVATGGAGKVARWMGRLAKTAKRVEKLAGAAEKLLEIEQRLARATNRIEELANTAKKIRSLARIVQIPQKVIALFKKLEAAEEQLKILKIAGAEVTAASLRGMVSTLAARAAGSKNVSVGSTVTNELARQAVMAWLDGFPISQKIKELRSKVNFSVVILSDFSDKQLQQFLTYFWLIWAREFLVRLALSVIRKVGLTIEIAGNESISAFGAALETTLYDLPLMTEANAKWIARTLVSSLRKVLVSIAQSLAKPLLA